MSIISSLRQPEAASFKQVPGVVDSDRDSRGGLTGTGPSVAENPPLGLRLGVRVSVQTRTDSENRDRRRVNFNLKFSLSENLKVLPRHFKVERHGDTPVGLVLSPWRSGWRSAPGPAGPGSAAGFKFSLTRRLPARVTPGPSQCQWQPQRAAGAQSGPGPPPAAVRVARSSSRWRPGQRDGDWHCGTPGPRRGARAGPGPRRCPAA